MPPFPRITPKAKPAAPIAPAIVQPAAALVLITRTDYYAESTIGRVLVQAPDQARGDGALTTLFDGFSMELPWLNNKPQKSCIYADEYEALWTMSPHFKRETWELQKVVGRSYIRCHAAGIATRDLLGCIAIGLGVNDVDKDGSMDLLRSKGLGQTMFDQATLKVADEVTRKVGGKDRVFKRIRFRIVSGNEGLDNAPAK